MARITVWVLVGALLLTAGCATIPAQKQITNLKQVVGSWNGWVGCHGCAMRFRVSMSIQDDGRWTMIVEQNPSFYGKVEIADGGLRWGAQGRPWYGTVTLVEERGREWLTFLRLNGEVWTEFDRAK